MTIPPNPSRRAMMTSGAAALGAAAAMRPQIVAAAEQLTPAAPVVAPATPPGGYNILFILVDQEHFFDTWPMPAPGREWIKQNGITFTNHRAASCVCSPARSTIYTGEHIQFTAIFDNANSLWQADMSTEIKTIGHRMAELGYHAAYQGKWHLSVNLDQVHDAIDAPFADYRRILESYGFEDFFGVGDINDTTLGGYNYDDTTTAFVTRWLRTKGEALRAEGKPWYLAVNFVNPHDVMYVNSDLPEENIQGKLHSMPIARPLRTTSIAPPGTTCPYRQPAVSPSTRQAACEAKRSIRKCRTFWSAPGRTRTAAGDCCATTTTIASATATVRSCACWSRSRPTVWIRTQSSCSMPTTVNSAAIIRCAARAIPPTASRTTCP
jgi:hypothetical protein